MPKKKNEKKQDKKPEVKKPKKNNKTSEGKAGNRFFRAGGSDGQ